MAVDMYTIVNKTTGVTPSKSKPMTYKELIELVDRFIAFNPSNTVDDKAKLAYYNKQSFYKVIEV